MVRRSVAAGAALLVFLLLLFAFKGCLDSRKEQAFQDYVSEVRALVDESDRQGESLFTLLSDPAAAGTEVEVQNQLNAFRNEADQFVERALDLDNPDELDGAQADLVEVLRFRRDGVGGIAESVPVLLTDEGDREQATSDIAGSMQLLLTSDVIFGARVKPAIETALREEDIAREEAELQSNYLADIEFLQPDAVVDRVGGGGGDVSDEEAAPGLHGNGLGAVTLGGLELVAGGQVTVGLGEDLAFDVQVANQGENTETDVEVNVTVGAGGDSAQLESVLDEIAAGETKSVSIPLTEEPPTGQTVPITVEIVPVPGEEMTDNNQGEFSATFTP